MNARHCTMFALGSVLVGLALQPSLAKVDTFSSVWANAAPVIDGRPDDWQGVPRGLDKSTQVEYAFRNDSANLYLLFVFKDPKFLGTIRATGLSVYFNTRGDKDKDRGVNFVQKMVGPEVLIAMLEKQGQALSDERKQELRSRPSYLLYDSNVVDGKGNVLGPAVGTGKSLPPVFRVAQKGSETAYEVRLPLGKREDHPAGIGTSPGQRLMVEFEWSGLTKEMREAMASQIGERGSQATEAERPFDVSPTLTEQPTNEPQASLSSMLRAPKRHAFWVDVTLALPGSN
jgi:hypothetical protein